jgi:hypothetical protein
MRAGTEVELGEVEATLDALIIETSAEVLGVELDKALSCQILNLFPAPQN